MKKFLLIAMTLGCGFVFGQDLVLTAVYDAPLTGGTPKGVELYATDVIADLSIYGISAAANGSGTSENPVFELSGSATSGQYLYISSESTQFASWFGFSPNFTSGEMAINGDDAIELFYDAVGDGSGWSVIDVFGDVDVDGTSQPWEYTDGWAYRNDETGPDGSTFAIGNWTFSGTNALDGESNNATASNPIPTGTYVDVVNSNTKLSFSTSAGFADELDGSLLLTISIANESASLPTSVDVELTSGSAGDLGNYTTQTLTFPANTTIDQTVTVTITDNSDLEGSKDFVFTLTSPSGGTSAEISSPSTFGLTLTDDDTPDLIINEIHAEPSATLGDANGDGVSHTSRDEFIEIVNNEATSYDISNWVLADGASDRHTFPNPTILNAGQSLVLFGGGIPTGDFGGAIVQVASSGSLGLNNGGDNIFLKSGGAEILNISYGGDANDEQSLTLDADLVGTYTKHSLATGSGGTLFSPGTMIDGTPFITGSTITWDGSEEDQEWSNGLNWDGGVVPTSEDNVIIADVSFNPIMGSFIAEDFAVNNLTINTGGDLTVTSGSSLAIFGTVTNNGTYQISRNSTGSAGYSILGSPVEGVVVSDLGADYIQEFDGSSYSSPGASDALTPGKGFFVGYDAASPSVSFTGTPNSGTITYGVTNTNFELVANPYSAPISITKFLDDNATVIAGAIYFWDDGGVNVGGDRGGDFVTTNSMGTTSISTDADGTAGLAGTSGAESGVITSTQGIYVEAILSDNVTFSSDQQVKLDGTNADANHYRKVDYQKVKMAISGNGLYNEILVGLGEDATFGRDAHLDARKLVTENALSFFSLIEDEKYVIQGLPLATFERVNAPLGFDLAESGTFTMSVVDFENISENVNVNLLDHLTGISYDLRSTESFEFTSEVVSNDQRFELQFSQSAILSVDGPSEELTIYGNTSELTIHSGFEGNQDVAIYTLDGKIAFKENVSFSNANVTISTDLIQNQVYVLRVGEQSFKFVIQ